MAESVEWDERARQSFVPFVFFACFLAEFPDGEDAAVVFAAEEEDAFRRNCRYKFRLWGDRLLLVRQQPLEISVEIGNNLERLTVLRLERLKTQGYLLFKLGQSLAYGEMVAAASCLVCCPGPGAVTLSRARRRAGEAVLPSKIVGAGRPGRFAGADQYRLALTTCQTSSDRRSAVPDSFGN